jgi:hypothetical protein
MIAEYNTKSFVFGIPGIVLQTGGFFIHNAEGVMTPMGFIIALCGTMLLLVGFIFYAKAKGRNPAWCLFGLLSIIGLIVLACLKDKSVPQASEKNGSVNT